MKTFNMQFEFPVLLGDIGGTNARFSILEQPAGHALTLANLKVHDFATIEEAILAISMQGSSFAPKSMFLSVAGPVNDDEIVLTNCHWIINTKNLVSKFKLDKITVINDFEAQALAATALPDRFLNPIGSVKPRVHGNKVILGAGTGLGIAGLIEVDNHFVPIASEGGHIDYAPQTNEDFLIFQHLKRTYARISAEELLSGRGILNIYRAICSSRNLEPIHQTSEEITENYSLKNNQEVEDTIRYFVDYLARFSGDMALIFNAVGGVYFGGGIIPQILDHIVPETFRTSFENKAPHNRLMENIATIVMSHPCPALIGMESYIRHPDCYYIGGQNSKRCPL